MMIILIIINLTFVVLNNKKENIINTENFKIDSKKKYIKNIVLMLFFFFCYIIFFKILKLFKQTKYIDLLILAFLGFNFIRNLRRLFVQKLKICFIKLVQYYLSKYEKFFHIYCEIITWQSTFWYWLIVKKFKLHEKNGGKFFQEKNAKILWLINYFFKFIGYFVMLVSFVLDLYIHNNILVVFSSILPWFGLYQVIYRINDYLNNYLNIRAEVCMCDWCYPPGKYFVKQINLDTVFELSIYLNKITKY